MIKFISLSFFSVLLLSGCEKDVSKSKSSNVTPTQNTAAPTPVATSSIPKDGNYDGQGEVTKINLQLGSIEVNHEEIKDLMPAMKMEFFVKDKSLLKGLSVGDRVDFVVAYKHPTEIIVGIKKSK